MHLGTRSRTLLGLSAAAALAAAPAGAAAASSKTIASVSTVDYRAVVVALRSSGGSAPTARVTVDTFRRSGGHWQRLDAARLAGPFFWKTVTAPHALCRFEITTASGSGGARPGVTVQLLRSPSLGCAAAETIPIAT